MILSGHKVTEAEAQARDLPARASVIDRLADDPFFILTESAAVLDLDRIDQGGAEGEEFGGGRGCSSACHGHGSRGRAGRRRFARPFCRARAPAP